MNLPGPPPLPLSVIIPVRNEARNLPRCLASLRGVGEVYVVDSQSTDATVAIAQSFDTKVVQFHYRGGWPKKRQWALQTLPLKFDWVLLLDADEALTPELTSEIHRAIGNPEFNGYYIPTQMHFLGRTLSHGDATFYKLSLFRKGKGQFECRFRDQDVSMADMEVHEHVIVDGATAKLKNSIAHENINSLSQYIQKHNEYSNWECQALLTEDSEAAMPAKLFGNQAQRRRWLKQTFFRIPCSSVVLFLYRYFLRLGFLDGIPGLIYCTFQAIQMFHTKSKIYELQVGHSEPCDVADTEGQVTSC